METAIQIRRLIEGEESALYEIYHSAIHLIACRDYSEDQLRAWASTGEDRDVWATRMHSINPFVAVLEGKPVGYADVQPNGYIDHFFVSGRHPRQGIGRSLMMVLEAEARRLGVRELTSHVSRTAQPFFERFGFHVVEQRLPVIQEIAIPNALMRRILSDESGAKS